jgi:putative SOS response-associated peptidase YedK
MCGRYLLKDPILAFDYFGVQPAFAIRPRYNIAPTQKIAVVPAIGRIEEMR